MARKYNAFYERRDHTPVDRLVVHGDTSDGKTFRVSVFIKRCPMCGRRLR